MDKLLPHHDYVGKTYGTSGLKGYGYDYELERLEQHSPVEYRMTLRYLDRFVPGGIFFGSGILRVAFFSAMFRDDPNGAMSNKPLHEQILLDGNVPAHPEGHPSTVHMTTIAEFETECGACFDELLFAGTESFTSLNQESFLAATPENQERWLDIVEHTAPTPEGLGIADHPLFIGRKRP